MRTTLVTTILAFLLLAGGCTSDPVGQAAELRALYKEAQVQLELSCADKPADPAERAKFEKKCAESKEKIGDMGPFVDALEIAAAAANKDPGKWINFQQLYIEYGPKLRSVLIGLVIRRYLGG